MDILEKGFRQYEITFGSPIPDPLKIPMLLKIPTESHRKELTLKFTLGERNYQKMADSIMGFSNDERVREQQLYGQKDMDVDLLGREDPPSPTTLSRSTPTTSCRSSASWRS